MPKPILHSHITNSPVNPTMMAVRITHNREDGMYIIGYVEHLDDGRCFAYTIDDYKLLCDPDDGEPMLFGTVEDAGIALVNQDVFHLRPGAVKSLR